MTGFRPDSQIGTSDPITGRLPPATQKGPVR